MLKNRPFRSVDFNRYFRILILRILYTFSHHFRIIPLSHFIHVYFCAFALSHFITFPGGTAGGLVELSVTVNSSTCGVADWRVINNDLSGVRFLGVVLRSARLAFLG